MENMGLSPDLHPIAAAHVPYASRVPPCVESQRFQPTGVAAAVAVATDMTD